MGFSPITVGDASDMFCEFTTDSATFPLNNVTTQNMAMHFSNMANGALVVGTGSWTITNAPAGLATYAPSAADVATPGTYRVYPVLMLTTGPKGFDAQILEIENLR